LNRGFDCAVRGDGEYAFEEVIQQSIHGIWARQIDNLNLLPYPDREAIDIKKYHYKIDGTDATSLITQRGCPYSCAFCCHYEGYRSVRFRSTQNVIDEIKELRNRYGYEAFMFWDDEFNLYPERTIKLCQALKPLKIKFRCFIRANLFSLEVAVAMRDAGCVEVGCGVESGSQRILDNINKGTMVKQNGDARELCRDLGIRFKAFLIIGLPGENLQSVQETKQWLQMNEPDDFDLTINTPYPGSPQWEHPENYDLIFDQDKMKTNLYDGSYYKGPPTSTVATRALAAETIVCLRDEIEDEFNRKKKSRELYENKEKKEG
jgi:radical SAM superfamily enzyme YgiQ (UPF0313 family)